MAYLATDQLVDLMRGTLPHLRRGRFTEFAAKLQNYVFWGKLLKRKQVKLDGGDQIERFAMTGTAGQAHQTHLFAEDTANVVNVMQQIIVPWRFTTTSVAFDEREKGMNSKRAIYDLMKTRYAQGEIDLADHVEAQGWNKPSTSSEKLHMWGIPTWIVKNVTTGFYGGNPTGFADGPGGLNSDDYSAWKNYSGTYSQISRADFIYTVREMLLELDWQTPVDIPDYSSDRDQVEMYCGKNLALGLADRATDQNDRLGPDLASMDGRTLIARHPLVRVKYLDSDTSDPLYAIDWGHMEIAVMRGENLRRTPPRPTDRMHRALVGHTDLQANIVMTKRRTSGVLYKV